MSTIRANNIQGLDAPNPAIELPIDGTVILASGFSGDLESKGIFTASGLTVDSTAIFAVGASGTPAIAASGDANTGIYFPAADTIGFAEGGNEAARIDSSGRLLVGTTSAKANFENASTTPQFQIESTSLNGASLSILRDGNDAGGPKLFLAHGRTDAGLVSNGDELGGLLFSGGDGSEFVSAAGVTAAVNGTPNSNDMPGRLVFSTTASGSSSPTERMRIDSAGLVAINATSKIDVSPVLLVVRGEFPDTPIEVQQDSSSTHNAITFRNSNGLVGSIRTSGSSTSYNTSSDYRLKENVVPVTDGITRLQQLNPARFNFIADPDKTVDGFLAHEVQDVVPEAISGEKNAVDDEGNPVYQGIDQSKLVPLLTAALQEAIEKIETFEARLTALESA